MEHKWEVIKWRELRRGEERAFQAKGTPWAKTAAWRGLS